MNKTRMRREKSKVKTKKNARESNHDKAGIGVEGSPLKVKWSMSDFKWSSPGCFQLHSDTALSVGLAKLGLFGRATVGRLREDKCYGKQLTVSP